MKVKELIAKLQEYDGELEVLTEHYDCHIDFTFFAKVKEVSGWITNDKVLIIK